MKPNLPRKRGRQFKDRNTLLMKILSDNRRARRETELQDEKTEKWQHNDTTREEKKERQRGEENLQIFCLFCLSRTVFEDNLATRQQVAMSSGRRLTTRIKCKFSEVTPAQISCATAVCIWQQLPTLETPGKSQSCHVCPMHSPKPIGGLSV